MSPSSASRRLRLAVTTRVLGAFWSLVVAVALFTRFDIDGSLSRDEGIYAYGGQQLARGVPPYASIFDAKGPLATMVAGAAAWPARLLGRDDIDAIRLAFFVCAVLSVLAVYLLAVRLFDSTLGGVTAAVVLSASWPFAVDALAGPNAKTPGVLFAVLGMWLMARRQWFWGAVAGGVAFLAWQPLAYYPFLAVVLALVTTRERRWRAGGLALAGAATPVLLTLVYFAVVGAFDDLLEAALLFPLTGVQHGRETVGERVLRITDVVERYYGLSGALFWVGLVLLVVVVLAHLARRRRTMRAALEAPVVSVVAVTLLLTAAYAATDFQSYPDLYPFLAYPALGLAGAVAEMESAVRSSVARAASAVAVVAALALLVGVSWVSFAESPGNNTELRAQRANACAVRRLQVPGTPIWSMGDPSVLVVTHRVNPDRFVYLTSGADRWKLSHTPGGFRGWTRQVVEARPSVVVVQGWSGPVRKRITGWLREQGYQPRHLGRWLVFLTPRALARAPRVRVRPTNQPTRFATGPEGRAPRGRHCG